MKNQGFVTGRIGHKLLSLLFVRGESVTDNFLAVAPQGYFQFHLLTVVKFRSLESFRYPDSRPSLLTWHPLRLSILPTSTKSKTVVLRQQSLIFICVRVGRIETYSFSIPLRFIRNKVPYKYRKALRFSRARHADALLTCTNKTSAFRRCFVIVRVGRIELPSQPWEGRILPLNHTRRYFIILF